MHQLFLMRVHPGVVKGKLLLIFATFTSLVACIYNSYEEEDSEEEGDGVEELDDAECTEVPHFTNQSKHKICTCMYVYTILSI